MQVTHLSYDQDLINAAIMEGTKDLYAEGVR